ncbi:30S ribosomal protein S3 [Dissostichus eleginoides]|uniref:30S ribosomal protein S3 n=1 Tax=Dissostichus eleginoides TaxID=100907 RepID=A0AAD9CQ13_DISEL|nr:30S ribosomal protein S3 [Dissostichus eleginoides]
MSLPPQQEHVIAIEDVELFHSGCLWKSMWAIMMERERGEGEGEKRRKRRSLRAFGGLLSSSTAANSITVHMCKHLRYLLV